MSSLFPVVGRYRVQIVYREPTYAEVSGTVRQYTGTFLVEARTEADAAWEGLQRFHHVASLSGVGWVREVLEVKVLVA